MTDPEIDAGLKELVELGDAVTWVDAAGKRWWKLTEQGMQRAAELVKSTAGKQFMAEIIARKAISDAKEKP